MTTGTVQTDKGLGLGLALAAVALIGAAIMLGGETQMLRAWGFAAAMLAAGIGIVAMHAFDA